MTQKPTLSPSESPTVSTPEAKPNLRERVKTFTDRELEGLMDDFEAKRGVVEELHEEETKQAVDQRMEELKVADAVKTRWQTLRASIKPAPSGKVAEMQKKAEESFLKKMVEKGGLTAVIASAGISILAWLGFSGAKALRSSIKEKGYLRTAIEGAKEHPIFAALIAAMGIKVGSEAYKFMSENSGEITNQIERVAGERGVQAIEVVKNVAGKAREFAGKAADATLKGIVVAFTTVLGGTYDEDTGVVTIGGATLRPTAIVAWQAGVRRRMGEGVLQKGYSTFLVEDRLHAILRQTDIVTKESQGVAGHKKILAKRALELMSDSTPDNGDMRKMELERIINTLESDLGLGAKNAAVNVQTTQQEMEQKLKTLEAEMDRVYKTEVDDFSKVSASVKDTMYQAEKKIISGEHGGDADNIKKEAVDTATKRINAQQEALLAKKLPVTQQVAAVASALSDSITTGGQGALSHHMNAATADTGRVTKLLEGTTRNFEKLGCSIKKVPGGKYITGAIVGYSMLPLAMQGVASLRTRGPEGAAARKALAVDVAQAGLGFVPGVGDALDLYSAATGKDLNGRELDSWQRAQMATFGTLGAAALAAGVATGGISIVGWRAVRGFLATRKATHIAKMASQGVDVATVTAKSIKAIEKGQDSVEVLDDMLKMTAFQRKALKVKGFVNNAQRTMQVVTYSQLGIQVVSGAMTLCGNVEGTIESAHGKVMQGIDKFEEITTPKTA